MSSLLDHGLIRTVAVERVVAPIASHICHLVLLCDSEEDPGHFSRLEEAARAVAQATENLAAAASRYAGPRGCWGGLRVIFTHKNTPNPMYFNCRRISATEDEVLRMEMSSLLESVAVSGQHVLLAAQKLGIQPSVTEHRDELISATQSVFLGVVKVEYNFYFLRECALMFCVLCLIHLNKQSAREREREKKKQVPDSERFKSLFVMDQQLHFLKKFP